MLSFIRRIAVVCFLALPVLIFGAANVFAAPTGGAVLNPGLLTPVTEQFPGTANVVRFQGLTLFLLEKGFVWEITDLTDAGFTVRSTPQTLELAAMMRPGDYLAGGPTKSREIEYVEIGGESIYIEAAVIEKKAGGGGQKDQFVGSDSWPYDVPIINVQNVTLWNLPFDGVPLTIVANNLYMEMSGDLLLGYNFDLIPPNIDYLLFEWDATLAMTIDYTVSVGGAMNHNFDLLNFSIPVFSVGYATVNVTVDLPTVLNADGPVCLGGGVAFSYGFSVGVQYKNGNLNPIWTSAPGNFNNLDPSYGAEANAEIKTTINIGVAASVGIPSVVTLASAAFTIGPYLDMSGTVSPCKWDLGVDISSTLNFQEFTGLICPAGKCDWTLFDAAVFADQVDCPDLTGSNCVCDREVCPKGCCNGKSCMPGTADDACGTNGASCVSCGAGHHCENGKCVKACDAGLCPNGCCNGTTCEPGDNNFQCGTGGVACVKCNGSQQCVNQQCLDMCDPQVCPAGCCSGQQCEPGDTNQYCGSAGAACVKCPAGKHCEKGACAAGVDDDDNDDNDDNDNDDNDTSDDDTTDDDTSPADDDASPAHHTSDKGSGGGCGC